MVFDSITRTGRRSVGGWAPLLIGLGIGLLLPMLLPAVFTPLAMALLVLSGPLLLLGFGVALIVCGVAVYRRGESNGKKRTAIGSITGGAALLATCLYLASRLMFG